MRVLALNGGSSSLKLALYAVGAEEVLELEGEVAPLGPDARMRLRAPESGAGLERAVGEADAPVAAGAALAGLADLRVAPPDAIGHRIVHGGPEHSHPARLTDALIAELRGLIPLAPLHLPAEIAVIEEAAERAPDVPQVACFDTAFHRRMPEAAQRYPLPLDLWNDGVRRYGFHGLSYEYVLDELGRRADGRVVIAHLGNGASLAAVSSGRPVDTTMGFTPAGGIPMGTRSGDLDPGVMIHLARTRQADPDELEQLVNRDAGLLGVSGLTSDMKVLLDSRAEHDGAALAVEMFCRSVRATIGAYAALLGGLDTLAFAGGIGEHAPEIRREVCDGLSHLGIAIDPASNDRNERGIAAAGAGVEAFVIPTNEALMIARHTKRVLSS